MNKWAVIDVSQIGKDGYRIPFKTLQDALDHTKKLFDRDTRYKANTAVHCLKPTVKIDGPVIYITFPYVVGKLKYGIPRRLKLQQTYMIVKEGKAND